MTKQFILAANKEIDTHKQIVEINQIIQFEGGNHDKFVVYNIIENEWGISYKLINIRTLEFQTSDIIQPLSEKFGIGYYYDDVNPTFLDCFEVQILLQGAKDKQQAEQEEQIRVKENAEVLKEIGRQRLAKIVPSEAQALIVARLKQDESDSYTDYFASSVVRTVILGFSKHRRDLFSEMRKYASNFNETSCLTEDNPKYEHREKYSMGEGYYLGESKYSGWIIEKVPVYNREQSIEEFAYIAGNEENICLRSTPADENNHASQTITGNFIIVDYSQKAIAVFGDTKSIKDTLSAIGGRFNSRLTHNGERKAGWIFQKSKEEQVKELLKLNN